MTVLYPASRASPIKLGYKDPDSVLDYAVLWDDWLSADEIILTETIEVTTGITIDSHEINTVALTLNGATQKIGSVVTIWLSSGTVGVTYTISCKVTTSSGRTDERSFLLMIRER